MITIDGHNIGQNERPFIIAEMSGNHNQSLDRALSIVDAAAAAGAQAIKIQTYTPDTMTLDMKSGDFYISDENSLWQGSSLYDLYEEAYTPWDWHAPIFDRARSLGIVPFSSPFDSTSVDFLENLDVACYKIASFENTDTNLIRRVSATGKPVIISTGMATVAELDDSVRVAREAGCKDLILLKCTSNYPATCEDINLHTIPHMRRLFDCEVGLSDHTIGTSVAVASIAMGATVIEKHFTLDRADGGVDSAFSMEPKELEDLVKGSHQAWQALGHVSYGPTKGEEASKQYRRSLYIVDNIEAGGILSPANIRAVRPGKGLPVKYFDSVVGKRVNQDVKRGTALSWDLIG